MPYEYPASASTDTHYTSIRSHHSSNHCVFFDFTLFAASQKILRANSFVFFTPYLLFPHFFGSCQNKFVPSNDFTKCPGGTPLPFFLSFQNGSRLGGLLL